MPEIDPNKDYTAKQIARMFGVSVGVVYGTLAANPTPFGKKLYSGRTILAAMAAKGHHVREQSPAKVAADIEKLRAMR